MDKFEPELEGQVLTEVPEQMTKLIKIVAHSFYSQECALIVHILLKHPCIREDDLLELVKLDKKQVRSAIDTLRKDKLIRSIIKGEKQDVGGMLKFNHYFISYKVFIDVIKYKLDRMRKKIDQDDKVSQSCQFYLCSLCDIRFSDFDVGNLMDLSSGVLRCEHCQTELIEDELQIKQLQDRSRVSRFNEQTKFYTALLKDTDNVKLAAEVVDPAPLKMKIQEKKKRSVPLWQTSGKEYNLYQESSIKVNLEGDKDVKAREAKQLPVWLSASTVVDAPQAEIEQMPIKNQIPDTPPAAIKEDYLTHLLQHEIASSSTPTSRSSSPQEEVEEVEEVEEEEEWMVLVEGKQVSLTDIEGDHVERMSEDEKAFYEQKYQEYCNSIMM